MCNNVEKSRISRDFDVNSNTICTAAVQCGKLRKFTHLTQFWQKFRESNGFLK